MRFNIQSKIFPGYKAFHETYGTWKANKETVVFTNGCFDIIHQGHIDSLLKAAELGTKLIIGLNSDQSVFLLKGINRPVFDVNARAIMLAALGFVDAVIQSDISQRFIGSQFARLGRARSGFLFQDSFREQEFVRFGSRQADGVPFQQIGEGFGSAPRGFTGGLRFVVIYHRCQCLFQEKSGSKKSGDSILNSMTAVR